MKLSFAQNNTPDIIIPTPENLCAIDLGLIYSKILALILIVSTSIMLIFLISGWLTLIKSRNNESVIKSARNKIHFSFIGLTVIIIIGTVLYFFGKILGIDFSQSFSLLKTDILFNLKVFTHSSS